ncbi:MAG: hypothetical protein Aureis2KO_04400 [Aureisphaera sp.]
MARLRVHQPWRIAVAVVLVGILLKLLHMAYDEEVLMVGLAGILILYPLHFFNKGKKSFLDYAKLFFAIFATLHYAFAVFHWSYGHVFTRLAQLSLVVLIIAYISQNEKSSKKNGLEILLYTVAGVGIVLGAILKILHWGYGDILLIVGMIAGVASIFVGGNSSKE